MTEPAPAPKKRLDLLDMEIRVWVPMKDGDVCLAMIGNGPILFKGKSPRAVREFADTWRKEERAKWEAKHGPVKKQEAAE